MQEGRVSGVPSKHFPKIFQKMFSSVLIEKTQQFAYKVAFSDYLNGLESKV